MNYKPLRYAFTPLDMDIVGDTLRVAVSNRCRDAIAQNKPLRLACCNQKDGRGRIVFSVFQLDEKEPADMEQIMCIGPDDLATFGAAEAARRMTLALDLRFNHGAWQ
jgi:hypothetical protein